MIALAPMLHGALGYWDEAVVGLAAVLIACATMAMSYRKQQRQQANSVCSKLDD